MSTIRLRPLNSAQTRLNRWRPRHRCGGFAIATAVFIIVILAALAVSITILTTQSQAGLARDMQGSRTYQAARAGLEWGAYQVLDPSNTTATSGSANLPNCPGASGASCPVSTTSTSVPTGPFAGTVLAGNTVTLQCSCADFTESGRNVRVFQLKSTAAFGAGATAVERMVSARVAYCRDPNGNPGSQPPYGCN
jgi:MSHA biogenesis protein MshP